MQQIPITSQEEYNKAVKSRLHIGNELVIKDTPDFISVHTDVTVGRNGRCKTDGKIQVTITAKENGIATAEGKTAVVGYDNANIIAKGNCKITLHDAAFGNCFEHCQITLKGQSKISAGGNCTVHAYDETSVSSSGSCKVYSCQKATAKGSDITSITAKDNCIVYATDNCNVQASDHCLVFAEKNAKIVSQDNCLIMTNGSPQVSLSGKCEHLNLDKVSDKNIMGVLKQMAQTKAAIERPYVAVQILKENIPPAQKEAVDRRLSTMGLKDQTAIKGHLYSMVEAVPEVKTQSNPAQDFQRQVELARKEGYVQGVCECAAVVGNEQNLGKKLLSEMNVTREMARKHAAPQTYKALEQSVFAPQPQRKQEQQQTRGRRL